MLAGLEAIRRGGLGALRLNLVTAVAGLGVAVAVTWAQVEAVAAPPAPSASLAQPSREGRQPGICLASPTAKRPCNVRRSEAATPPGAHRIVKATAPRPPRSGPPAPLPAVPASMHAAPRGGVPDPLVAPELDRALDALAFAPAAPGTPAPWRGSVRPMPREGRVAGHVASPELAAPSLSGAIYVQVGAFAEAANADRAVAVLSALGYGVGARTLRGGAMRAVAAGPFVDEAEARAAVAALQRSGFAGAYVTR